MTPTSDAFLFFIVLGTLTTATQHSIAASPEIRLEITVPHDNNLFGTALEAIIEERNTSSAETGYMFNSSSGEAFRGIVDHRSCWILGSERSLTTATSRSILRPIAASNSGEFDAFKRGFPSPGEFNDINWVALAWIDYQDCEIRDRNECDPAQEWRHCGSREESLHCIEKSGTSQYIVKMRIGHGGWWMPSIGLSNMCTGDKFENHRISFIETFNSVNLHRKLGESFLMTARINSRDISFELYDGYADRPISTLTGAAARPATVANRQSTGSYNTCGGKELRNRACPMFVNPQGDIQKQLERLSSGSH